MSLIAQFEQASFFGFEPSPARCYFSIDNTAFEITTSTHVLYISALDAGFYSASFYANGVMPNTIKLQPRRLVSVPKLQKQPWPKTLKAFREVVLDSLRVAFPPHGQALLQFAEIVLRAALLQRFENSNDGRPWRRFDAWSMHKIFLEKRHKSCVFSKMIPGMQNLPLTPMNAVSPLAEALLKLRLPDMHNGKLVAPKFLLLSPLTPSHHQQIELRDHEGLRQQGLEFGLDVRELLPE